jgi:cytoskeletal protein RodZ
MLRISLSYTRFIILYMGASILETPRMTAKWQNKLNSSLADSPAATNQSVACSSNSPVDPPLSSSSSSESTSENSRSRIIPKNGEDDGSLTTRISRIRAVFSFKNPSENVFFWLPFVTLLREGAEVSHSF